MVVVGGVVVGGGDVKMGGVVGVVGGGDCEGGLRRGGRVLG